MVGMPPSRKAGDKENERSELLQGRTFKVPPHTLKNVRLRVLGERNNL
jgi:hypothetical protein